MFFRNISWETKTPNETRIQTGDASLWAHFASGTVRGGLAAQGRHGTGQTHHWTDTRYRADTRHKTETIHIADVRHKADKRHMAYTGHIADIWHKADTQHSACTWHKAYTRHKADTWV